MNGGSAVFSRRTARWLIVIGVVSFVGSMVFMLAGGEQDDARGGARVGGRPGAVSGLGHRAFVKTLRKLGVPVVISRYRSASKAVRGGLLYLGEPRVKTGRQGRLRALLAVRRVLLVLPKRNGLPAWNKPKWVGRARLLHRADVERVLRVVDERARVVRPKVEARWSPNRFGVSPTITDPQFIAGSFLRPVVATDRGVLVGETVRYGARIWIVADPDIFANHGIGKGGNARLAIALVEALRPAGRPVIVDTTIHGIRNKPSLWNSMFQLPFVVATLSALAAVAVVLWGGVFRFGAPRRSGKTLEAGKITLIDNATRLLQFGKHQHDILDRYRKATAANAARHIHARTRRKGAELAAWLDRVGEARGTSERYSDLKGEAEALARTADAGDRKLVDAARRLHRWKREILGNGK